MAVMIVVVVVAVVLTVVLTAGGVHEIVCNFLFPLFMDMFIVLS